MSDPKESPQGLGLAVGRGVTAIALSTIANRVIALIAQALLGLLLTKADFGIFAIATGAASIVAALRDGGLRTVLIQRGAQRYAGLSGPVFWMSLSCNLAAGILLAGCGPLLVRSYGDERLLPILTIMGVLLPAGTPLLMLESKLRIDLRFGVLAKIAAGSALGRYGITVLSAFLGCGPLSMVYGLVAATVIESVACYVAAPDQPWRRRASIGQWPGLFAQGKWTVLQIVGASLVFYGAYLPMGLIVPSAVVGEYFFAFSIISISGQLAVTGIESVLLPTIARLADLRERRRSAVARALRGIVLTCTPLSLLIGVSYAALQRILWPGGQWDSTVTAVQIMAFSYPLFILHVVPRTALAASGEFRQSALLMILLGIGLILAAMLGAWGGGSASSIAAWVGLYSSGAGVLTCCMVLRSLGQSFKATVGAILPLWLSFCGIGIAVILIDASLAGSVPLPLRLVLAVAVASVAFAVNLRLLFTDAVTEVLNVMPVPVGKIARAILM